MTPAAVQRPTFSLQTKLAELNTELAWRHRVYSLANREQMRRLRVLEAIRDDYVEALRKAEPMLEL
jgi:hypothetical protein